MNKKVKFVFIQPFSLFSNLLDMGNSVPIQLLYIATVLKKRLEKTEIKFTIEISNLIDEDSIAKPINLEEYQKFKRDFERFAEKFDDGSDLIFGISAFTSNYYLASVSIIKIIRELFPKSLICVGGFHPNYLPEDYTIENDVYGSKFSSKLVDYIFLGESEITFSELMIDLINKNNHYSNQNIRTQIINCDIIKNLTIIPYLDMNLYRFTRGVTYQVPIYFSRSCPFRCNFCSEYTYIDNNNERRQWRLTTPDYAISQLKELSRFFDKIDSIPHIQISDPLFCYPDWRVKFYEQLCSIDFKKELFSEIRVDQFSIKKEVPLLKDLNMSVAFGFESGSPTMLRIMNKTNNPERYIEKMKQISFHFNKNNIYCIINNILGHPGETKETLDESLNFIESIIDNSNNIVPFFFKYLFSLGSRIYDKMEYYNQTYGTRFYYPEYWKQPKCSFLSSAYVDPSRDLSLFDLLENLKIRLKDIYRKSAHNLQKFDNREFIYQRYNSNLAYRQFPYWFKLIKGFKDFKEDKEIENEMRNKFWNEI